MTAHFVGWHNWRWALRIPYQRTDYGPHNISYRYVTRILFWQFGKLQPCSYK
jgi:hypothetical protein